MDNNDFWYAETWLHILTILIRLCQNMIELFLLHLEDREYKIMEGASSLLSSYDT